MNIYHLNDKIKNTNLYNRFCIIFIRNGRKKSYLNNYSFLFPIPVSSQSCFLACSLELRRPPAQLNRRLLRSSLQKYWLRHCGKVMVHARLCVPIASRSRARRGESEQGSAAAAGNGVARGTVTKTPWTVKPC